MRKRIPGGTLISTESALMGNDVLSRILRQDASTMSIPLISDDQRRSAFPGSLFPEFLTSSLTAEETVEIARTECQNDGRFSDRLHVRSFAHRKPSVSSPLLSVQDAGSVRVVTFLTPELVEHVVYDVRPQLLPLVAGQKRVVLNLSQIRFLASAGLGLIVQVAHRVYAAGGKLALCDASPQVAYLFTGPTNLIQVVPLYGTEQEAIHVLAPA
jgi:anti-anti-sigma factor